MKVFLSGKVDGEHGAWRDVLLGHTDLKNAATYHEVPVWALYPTHDQMCAESDRDGVLPWPQIKVHHPYPFTYVGPYRQITPSVDAQCDGYFHGIEAFGSHGTMCGGVPYVMQECRYAIAQADLVFCVINTFDCYGTLTEIGLAHALGKFVAAVFFFEQSSRHCDDFWFVRELCQYTDDLPEICSREALGYAICRAFVDALAAYALTMPHPRPGEASIPQAVRSVEAIAHWTSDPRARREAAAVVKRLTRGASA